MKAEDSCQTFAALPEYMASLSQRQQFHFNFNLPSMLQADLWKIEPLALHTYAMVLRNYKGIKHETKTSDELL